VNYVVLQIVEYKILFCIFSISIPKPKNKSIFPFVKNNLIRSAVFIIIIN
jgi:hypothetical protein